MDFFDLPDEAYTPVQLTEEKHDENVAEVEDLFGNLLMDDEPEVKKHLTILQRYFHCSIRLTADRTISISTAMKRLRKKTRKRRPAIQEST